jgi:phenylpropionate dioxygenase-like ring-hydroxylating dioxygenase large terminal subunit
VNRYVDPRFHELEKKHLWTKSWLLAGHVDEMPEPGCFKQWNIAGDPIILVRGKDARIRAFFNSCRHRGAALVREQTGKVNVLACKFHAWTYNLEGDLVFVPAQHNFPCLDKADNGLVQIRCELWGNLIFVNRDENAPPLLDYLGRAVTEMAHFDLGQRRLGITTGYELKSNWKVALEAFLEGYHIDTVHPVTVAPYLDYRGCVTEWWGPATWMMFPNYEDADFKYVANASQDPRHEMTRNNSFNFQCFPNLHAPLTESMIPVMLFWPTGAETCTIQVMYLEAPEIALSKSEIESAIYEQVDTVLREDFANVEAQQRSYRSGAIKNIHIGYCEWRIYRWHEMIDECIGVENIPPELRIQPQLAPVVG